MSAPILKSYVDERGNISVRVSHDVQVLTREEAGRIEAEYKRMQTENAKLREEIEAAKHDLSLFSGELVASKLENSKLRELALGEKWCSENYGCENLCPLYDKSEPEHCREERLLRDLGVEGD